MKAPKKRFIPIVLAISSVFVVIMLLFSMYNNKRIVSYHVNNLQDNTSRDALVIDDEINIGYSNIKLLSELVSKSLTGPSFDIGSA